MARPPYPTVATLENIRARGSCRRARSSTSGRKIVSWEDYLANSSEIERKVFFFRADVGQKDTGGAVRLVPFEQGPVIDHLRRLPASERQLRKSNGRISFCRIYRSDSPQRLMLTSIGASDFPDAFKFTNSTFRDIELEDDEGIAHTTHFSFFHNNIVGMVAAVRGPGASLLEEYLRKKVHKDHPHLNANATLTPLVAEDFESRLEQFRWLKVLRIRISHHEVAGPADAEDSDDDTAVLGILRRMSHIGEAGEYEIGWKPTANARKGHIPPTFIRLARRLIRRNDVLKDDNARLVVEGETEEGRTEEINLLDGKIFFQAKVLKQSEGSRSLAPGPAFAAIQEVYEENREYIESAASIYT